MDVSELRMWDELFSTDGWKKLLTEAQTEVDHLAVRALHETKSFDDTCFLRGQSASLLNLINLEDSILNMAKAQAEEEAEDNADL